MNARVECGQDRSPPSDLQFTSAPLFRLQISVLSPCDFYELRISFSAMVPITDHRLGLYHDLMMSHDMEYHGLAFEGHESKVCEIIYCLTYSHCGENM